MRHAVLAMAAVAVVGMGLQGIPPPEPRRMPYPIVEFDVDRYLVEGPHVVPCDRFVDVPSRAEVMVVRQGEVRPAFGPPIPPLPEPWPRWCQPSCF